MVDCTRVVDALDCLRDGLDIVVLLLLQLLQRHEGLRAFIRLRWLDVIRLVGLDQLRGGVLSLDFGLRM